MMYAPIIPMDGQNNKTSRFHYNFDLVHMKSKFVEGIRIEKTRVGFRSKLRNPSVVGNNPKVLYFIHIISFHGYILKALFWVYSADVAMRNLKN